MEEKINGKIFLRLFVRSLPTPGVYEWSAVAIGNVIISECMLAWEESALTVSGVRLHADREH